MSRSVRTVYSSKRTIFYTLVQFLLLPFLFGNALSFAQVPIGQWRGHLNYQQTTQVIKGDKVYCATNSSIFSIDNKDEAERFDKTNGLTDIGVRAIGWDTLTKQLIIAYNNSNVDIIRNRQVKNISDIKRSSNNGDKTINTIYCRDGLAFICSGLGVIIIDLVKYEIKDTWQIGANGMQLKVNGLTTDNLFFYAATSEGIKKALLNGSDLSDYRNWQMISGSNGLPAGAYSNITIANGNLIAQKNDSIFSLNNNNWSLLYYDAVWPIISVTSSENRLLICQRTGSGSSRVILLNSANGAIDKTISQNGTISFPRSALYDHGAIWVADQFGGLSRSTATIDRFIPNGPPGAATGDMIIHNNTLYAASGSVNDSWNYLYNRDGVFDFKNNGWNFRGYYNLPVLDSVFDFITLAGDPINESLWAGSYGSGLVNLKNMQARIFKQHNSTLQPAIGDPSSYRVSGLAFDNFNNLWVSNYGAAQNLHVRKADSTWKSFTIPFLHLENAVSQIVADDMNQLWIVSPKGNGVFCFNYGQTIDNISDDRWKFYRQGAGNGNLPSNNVLCLLKDKNGFIWVGTDRGIGIIKCIGDIFAPQSCDALLPVVQQDRFTGLLFRDETIQCMAIDAANRKWIGTKNGVWLISADGGKILYRFTVDNSPLFSNDVKRITIDPVTGEVFMGTISGICSFRGTATEGGETNQQVLVFPNPVPPGYNGTIAIKGLVTNALVKITELNGRLVFQTRALGGQAVWNGLTYKGDKVASGIYLVIVRDDSDKEKIVTKIAITSGR